MRPNPTAMDLELLEAGGSAGVHEGLGQTHVRVTASQYYELMLETCERLFDNQIEQLAFEDQMREMFGLHARHVFLYRRACNLTRATAGRVQDLHHRQGARLPGQTCKKIPLLKQRIGF